MSGPRVRAVDRALQRLATLGRMPSCRLATAILVLLAVTVVPAAADPPSRVRASHPRLVKLLVEGGERSATLRALVARLDASDLIVHIQAGPPGHGLAGAMQFVAATAFTRYLRVTVRTDLPAFELTALIGHELRHAVEVADSSVIRNESSFRQYYETQGRPTQRGGTVTFDTHAAVEAGQRVAVELRMTRFLRSETSAR